ncbi:MAG: hypothetical protein K2Q01_11165, partial [Rickettsiales bacterium]|nr:hypothetical protein [Rickettsiales bacterium]
FYQQLDALEADRAQANAQIEGMGRARTSPFYRDAPGTRGSMQDYAMLRLLAREVGSGQYPLFNGPDGKPLLDPNEKDAGKIKNALLEIRKRAGNFLAEVEPKLEQQVFGIEYARQLPFGERLLGIKNLDDQIRAAQDAVNQLKVLESYAVGATNEVDGQFGPQNRDQTVSRNGRNIEVRRIRGLRERNEAFETFMRPLDQAFPEQAAAYRRLEDMRDRVLREGADPANIKKVAKEVFAEELKTIDRLRAEDNTARAAGKPANALDNYLRRNAEFLQRAGMAGRKDLALAALTSSREELDAKMLELAPLRMQAEARRAAPLTRTAAEDLRKVNATLRELNAPVEEAA